ncbi:MAG: hypothetical protein AB1734_11970 [Elusimicrobiota bacterium]|jgi:hypothetical protein
MATPFASTLSRLRKEAGHKTSYRFYHDSGGSPVLKLSYRKYLAMEQGKILPVFARLRGLAAALGHGLRSPGTTELIKAWLRASAGDEAYGELLEPLLRPAPSGPGLSPMQKTMERSLAGKKYHIRPAQLAVITESRDNYACFLALSSDTGKWTPQRLAPKLRLTPARAARAMARLAAAKLLKKQKDAYTCPLTPMMKEYPPVTPAVKAMMDKFFAYQEQLLAAGTPVFHRRGTLRSDAASMGAFVPVMRVSLSSAQAYATEEGTEGSAFYAVEGKVTKLFDF